MPISNIPIKPLNTQKTLPVTTVYPVPHNGFLIFHIRNMIDFLSPVRKSGLTNSFGWSISSTKSHLYIIILSTYHIAWYSFFLGSGFLRTNIHHGQSELLVHIEMDSYKNYIHEGMNTSFVRWFYATIVWRTSNNLSLKDGGIISLNKSAAVMFSNMFPIM